MSSNRKSVQNGPAERFWYGDCPTCAKETRKVIAHVLSGKVRKLPACTVCRALYPEGTVFRKE